MMKFVLKYYVAKEKLIKFVINYTKVLKKLIKKLKS